MPNKLKGEGGASFEKEEKKHTHTPPPHHSGVINLLNENFTEYYFTGNGIGGLGGRSKRHW